MIRSLVLALACGLAVAPAHASTAKIGAAAPAFTLTDSDGRPHALADYAGKTVVLEWTNHECPFVRKHYGADNMQAQQRAATGDGIVWLTVNSSAPGNQGHVDGPHANSIRTAAKAAQTAYLLDPQGDTGRAYDAKTTPHMYVIDPEGVLRYAGAIDSVASTDSDDIPQATQYVTAALADLKAGKPVAMPVTQPYGCSVKYD